jgi:hypothetical protein
MPALGIQTSAGEVALFNPIHRQKGTISGNNTYSSLFITERGLGDLGEQYPFIPYSLTQVDRKKTRLHIMSRSRRHQDQQPTALSELSLNHMN